MWWRRSREADREAEARRLAERAEDQQERRESERRSRRTAWAVGIAAVVLPILASLVIFLVDRDDGPDEPAYRVSVQRDVDEIDGANGPAGGEYVVVGDADPPPDPPTEGDTCVGRYAWARGELGAVDGGRTAVRVTVSGSAGHSVQLTDVDVVVTDRADPPQGAHIACPGSGARNELTSVAVDLDQEPAALTTTDEDDRPVDFSFDVSRADAEVFDIAAVTEGCDCEWYAELTLTVDGEEVVERVTDEGGKPFRTVAGAAVGYRWLDGAWEREDAGTGDVDALLDDVAEPCRLLTPDDLAGVVDTAAPPEELPPMAVQARAVPMAASTCTYGAPSTDGSEQNVVLSLGRARSDEEAGRELAARAGSGSGPAEPVEGLGDEAVHLDGQVIARAGAFVIAVYGVLPGIEGARTEALVRAALDRLGA